MPHPFYPVPDVATLEAWFARSATEPVVFFNYDRFCPINVIAYGQLAYLETPVALVDVTRDHAVKRALAARTGVRHESPQVIVVRDGGAVWSAAHGAITAAGVRRAVAGAAGPASVCPEERPAGGGRPWYARWRPRGG